MGVSSVSAASPNSPENVEMRTSRSRLARYAVALALVCFVPRQATAQRLAYPATRKVDHVDTYFGVGVADPYRWLEDENAPETAAWVEAENKVTSDYFARITYRD